MSRVEPNRNVYVGHRYVPKIFGEWDKQNEYEGLSIVTHKGNSYTSKKRVPVGIDILNDEFWAITGNYNAQVEYYREETERVSEDLLLKSDKTYVDTELDKKSNQTYVDTELGKKSDKVYVDNKIKENFVSVNDYSSLKEAIESNEESDLLFPAGTYNIPQGIKATLKKPRKWVSSGEVIFNYTGTSNDIMIEITLNNNPLNIEGDFLLNGNDRARVGLLITNQTVSMDNLINLNIDKVKVTDIYSNTVGQSAVGIMVRGSFDSVNLENCEAHNISRAEGVGIPGSQGSDGITVTHYESNSYAKNIIINNSFISNINSNESADSPNNVDCDGIKVFAPVDENGVVVDSYAFINGGIYEDCKGRSIKSQIGNTIINSPTFKRSKVKTIRYGMEVDFQYGNGTITNWQAYYYDMPNGDTPLGPSFKLFVGNSLSRGNRVPVYNSFNEGTIFNYISTAYPIPYIFILSSDTYTPQSIVTIDKVKLLGSGRVSRVISGEISNINKISITNSYFNWITSSLIHCTDVSNIEIDVINTVQGNTSVNPELFDGVGFPVINAQMNKGFYKDLMTDRNINSSDSLASNKIVEKTHLNDPSTMAFESSYIEPGEIHTFSKRNHYSMILVNVNRNRGQCIFGISGTLITPLAMSDFEINVFEFGDGENPDIEDKINIWIEEPGIIKIKNNGLDRRLFKVTSLS